MIADILSWLIPVFGLAAFWFAAKHPWGWWIGICQQITYAAFGAVTEHWGFVISAVLSTAVFARNYVYDEKKLKKQQAKKARKLAKKVKQNEREARAQGIGD